MSEPIGPRVALLWALLIAGCSEKPSINDSKDKTAVPSRRGIARIVFQLPGDDIGNQEYRTILEAIKAEILRNNLGDIVSSGYGMGNMELVVAIDRDDSTGAIKRIIGDVYPKARYRIEHRTR